MARAAKKLPSGISCLRAFDIDQSQIGLTSHGGLNQAQGQMLASPSSHFTALQVPHFSIFSSREISEDWFTFAQVGRITVSSHDSRSAPSGPLARRWPWHVIRYGESQN